MTKINVTKCLRKLSYGRIMHYLRVTDSQSRKNLCSQKPEAFLMFSGGIDKQHRAVIG